MKLNDKSGLIMVLALMLGGIMQAGAQTEYKTNVSIREQLVNGTVPGLRYGPKKIQPLQQAVVLNKSANKQSLGEQIKNGTFGGLQVTPGGGHKFKANVQAAKRGGAKGQVASEVKQEAKKALEVATTLPTQGTEPAAVKTAVSKTPTPPMQGENASPAGKEPVKNNN